MTTATADSAPRPVSFIAFGGESPLSQIDRIRQGLHATGSMEVPYGASCDLVYANDAGTHGRALAYRAQYAQCAKLILNVLDIPEALFPPDDDYDYIKLSSLGDTLRRADAVTAISPFVQSQIMRYFGLMSYCVWNPVKDVNPDLRVAGQRPYPYRFLLSGRLNDPNKRARSLAIPALIAAGVNESEVAVCGGEWPGWGTNLGVVGDETLNALLNSVDMTVCTTALAGLELGPIESVICGAVPILCYDMSTFRDVGCYPQHWGCYPSVTALAYRLRTLMDNPALLAAEREHCLTLSPILMEKLDKRAVAERILNVYGQLTKAL